jgi:hypothetical protein
MLILALVEDRPRHGYEIAVDRAALDGVLHPRCSLYPLLRLEKRGRSTDAGSKKQDSAARRFCC